MNWESNTPKVWSTITTGSFLCLACLLIQVWPSLCAEAKEKPAEAKEKPAEAKERVFYSDFEKGHPTWKWYTHGKGGERKAILSDEFSRKGKKSAKFIMDRSKGGFFWRAMFRKSDKSINGMTGERWIGFSTYLPAKGKDAFKVDIFPELLFQLHNNPYGSPIFGLEIIKGKIKVIYRFADSVPQSKKTGIKRGIGHRPHDVADVVTGKWVDWVFHLKLSPLEPKGIVEVWTRVAGQGDYRKVLNEQNVRFGYPTEKYPGLDIGLYKWPWKKTDYKGNTSPFKRRVVYFDEFRMTDETGTFKDVAVQ